jgi:hypothetical protein
MSNLIKDSKKKLARMERGQVLMVVAVAIVGIIAIIGIALDVGVMFIENARLRRAVDSAALAAALQFREGYQMSDLDKSAIDFLRLNGVNDPNALVQVCMQDPGDPPSIHHNEDLCTDPPRKLVRVVAAGTAYLAFLPVIGIDSAPITAEATSETASVEVVLVLDRSDSMTWAANVGDDMRDPSLCNAETSGDGYMGDCHPFDDVKRAAVSFVEQLYFPYDRVAVVTFDKTAHPISIGGSNFSNDMGDIISAIKGLTVYEGEGVYPNGNPSRGYNPDGSYYGLDCPRTDPSLPGYDPGDASPAPCTTTNIGAGMYLAGGELASGRQGSLWVVILLTDGVANAGYDDDFPGKYFCPESTWGYSDIPPKCNDGRSATRHNSDTQPALYDAEDYAYDAADFVANGQNGLVFTIGLGNKVTQVSSEDGTPLGELFLRYAAEEVPDANHGLYTFAPNSAQLREVFRKIAENIATRLAH